MSLLRTAFSVIARALPTERAYAHCDIPCGIYDPIAAKIAAQTVQKMVMRIQALQKPSPTDSTAAWATYENTLGRYIAVKEEHATLCKKELLILWTDYFKPEHLAKFPDLHDAFWKAAKLGSTCKQQVNLEAAKELVAAVDRIAVLFWQTKGVTWHDSVEAARFGS
ncbi:MAG: putative nickel-containing superoxide dismutase precursor [Dehalococcoidia bacterium]|nr:putative nickel-containing superoxide dismutase precursor [Dehalococcoidia bacterium]